MLGFFFLGGGQSNASQVQSSSHPLCNVGALTMSSTCYPHQRSLCPAPQAGDLPFTACTAAALLQPHATPKLQLIGPEAGPGRAQPISPFPGS